MKQWLRHSLWVVAVLLTQMATAHAGDRLPAHHIIAQKLIDVLPPAIAPLYREHIETFELHVSEPADAWPLDPKLKPRNRWHDVQADLTAGEQSPEARRSACRAFPRDLASAKTLYREHGRRFGGVLPWAIDECHRELVRAFRSAGEAEVLAWSGYLTHFAADAVNPLRVSAAGTANRTPNAQFGSARGPHPDSAFLTVRERFGTGLIGRWAGSYRADIALTHDDYAPIADPRSAAFAVITESLELFDRIAGADRECLNTLGIENRHAFTHDQEAYYAWMNDCCGALCVERLRAGTLFAADLIGGAWQAAGAPRLQEIRAHTKPAPATGQRDRRDHKGFVGSKYSDVFHKRDCPFAKRISEDNAVSYDSALQARRAGRRPCRHCKPE